MATTANPRGLSPREIEVISLMSEGKTNGQIATVLAISPETVKTHARHIYRKLETDDRAHAVATGLREGWIE